MGHIWRLGHLGLIGLRCLSGLIRLGGQLHDEWQFDDKGCALIGSGALGAHAAAMHLRQVAHYRQSKPQPSLPPCARSVALTEPVEDEWQKVRSDSDARVADRD